MRCGVAADHTGDAILEAERPHQRIGEARDLVGDDAPANVGRFKGVQRFGHAREKGTGIAERGFVLPKELLAQRLEPVVTWCYRECATDESACAMRCQR